MQALSKETLKALDSPKAKAIAFVDALRNIPEGFTWDYERIQDDCRGCAITLARYLGVIDRLVIQDMAEAFGLPSTRLHQICYRLHEEHCVAPKQVTAEQVAAAFEALI